MLHNGSNFRAKLPNEPGFDPDYLNPIPASMYLLVNSAPPSYRTPLPKGDIAEHQTVILPTDAGGRVYPEFNPDRIPTRQRGRYSK